MKSQFQSAILHAMIAMILLGVCLFGTSGCAHNPTAADYARIDNNPNLTIEQKRDQDEALTPDPTVLYYQELAPVGIIGVLLLVGALIAKKKIDEKALAAIDLSMPGDRGRSHSPASSKKPSVASHKPTVGPPASSLESVKPQEKPERKLPSTQAEVDAIPTEQRSMSFFSSRPLPLGAVRPVTIFVGYRKATVYATEQEVEKVQSGKIPRVRAFTIKGKTVPWYEWNKFDPYKHYWAMEGRGWVGTKDVIACWMEVEQCSPSLEGYNNREHHQRV